MKVVPEKPSTKPWADVLPIIVIKKSCAEGGVDLLSYELLSIPEELRASVGLATGSEPS